MYHVEIGASNTVKKDCADLNLVQQYLRRANGSVSILQGDREIFLGTADQARDWVEFEIEIRRERGLPLT